MKENIELRLYARRHQVPLWMIAKHLGISEPTLYIRLRTKFTDAQDMEFRKAVDALERGMRE